MHAKGSGSFPYLHSVKLLCFGRLRTFLRGGRVANPHSVELGNFKRFQLASTGIVTVIGLAVPEKPGAIMG